jgi:hypothetical protein
MIAQGLNPAFEINKMGAEREIKMQQAQEDLDMQADNAIKIAQAQPQTQAPKNGETA